MGPAQWAGSAAYLLLRSSRSAASSTESKDSSSMAGDFDSDSWRSLVLSALTSVAPMLLLLPLLAPLLPLTEDSSLLKLSWMGSLDLRGMGAWATGEPEDWAAAAAAASASFT